MRADFRISTIVNSPEHRPSEANSRSGFQDIPYFCGTSSTKIKSISVQT